MNKQIFGLLPLVGIAIFTACGSGSSVLAAHRSPYTAPSITTRTLPSGVVSTPYSDSLTATGGTTPYTWAIQSCSGACNTGLSFSASGLLSGTPANAGTSTFTFVVTDARGRSSSASRSLIIAAGTPSTPPATPPSTPPATPPVSITSSTLPNGTVSSSYNASLAATGGTTPYTWSLTGCSGVCDPNLTLSQAGVLSGTPSNSGTSTYSVGATDATGQTASASLGLTIAAAPSSSTANYFVSPSGSDSNPCTQTSPCATPDHAEGLASPGETVQVAAGTYDYGTSALNITHSGTAGKYITVTCATRGACKIQSATTGNTTIAAIQASYIVFDGFEITNTNPAVYANNIGLYINNAAFVKVTRNTIHGIEVDCSSHGGGGIQTTDGTHDLTFDSNLIYDIGWPDGGSSKCHGTANTFDGILPETSGGNIVITNNIIYHVSGGWGLGPGGYTGSEPVVITNNLIFSNDNGGIVIAGAGSYSADYSTITNNTIFDNGTGAGKCGIYWYSAGTITHALEANNDVYGNAGGDYCYNSGTPIHTGNISVDPSLGTTFVNWKADGGGDYHQKAGSPTTNNGTSSTGAPATDFDGNPRPQGAANDIGAYESPN